jgi:hypothetical protein
MNTYLKFMVARVNVNSESELNIGEEGEGEGGSGDLQLMGRSWEVVGGRGREEAWGDIEKKHGGRETERDELI